MNIQAHQFQKLILEWFDLNGRKHLPWQQNKNPYRVWVSEIMLQQTQVQTVIDYFQRFMQHFPDLQTLAQAPEDDVLYLWAGLGYYSRARMLHRAAKIIATQHQYHFPDNLDDLKNIPGIGPSTAGAILAIAFNKPATILDGNVKRVLSRLHAIKTPINDKNTEKKLWELAISYTPTNRVADYTQAMMDIGATLCTRQQPNCPSCPFKHFCQAHRDDIVNQLPIKKTTVALPKRAATFLIIKHNKDILLVKRPPTGIWSSLWCFPEIAGKPDKETIKLFCQQQLGQTLTQYQVLKDFKHTFTHYHLQIYPILLETSKKIKKIAAETQIWYNLANPQRLGLPKPIQKILGEIDK